tara:strand:- start:6375 stop:6605 length:231 start_codon:yes stop_codon:yes gene_type:complete
MKTLITKVKLYASSLTNQVKDCVSTMVETLSHRLNKWPYFTVGLFAVGIIIGGLDTSLGMFIIGVYLMYRLYKTKK